MDDDTAQLDAAAVTTASRDAGDAATVAPSESKPPLSRVPGTDVGGAAAEADGAAEEKDGKKRLASGIADDVADEPVAKRAAGLKGAAAERGERVKDEGKKGETAVAGTENDEDPVRVQTRARARPRARPPSRTLSCVAARPAELGLTNLLPVRPRSGSPNRCTTLPHTFFCIILAGSA